MKNIDFVVTWVDGADPKWLQEKQMYSQKESKTKDAKSTQDAKTFREWDTFKYWFRGVEKFAPWVNHIYVVTSGQKPGFLNFNNPKLTLVSHDRIMPADSLPTFNSRAIEMNLSKIPGLSDQFVYFNDDMYLISKVEPDDFFKSELPRDVNIISPILPERYGTASTQTNNMEIINEKISKSDFLKNTKGKLFRREYGKYNLKSMLNLSSRILVGLQETHLPTSFLKSSFDYFWENETDVLNSTTHTRFKNKSNVNQWLFRDWQIVTGRFIPRSISFGKLFSLKKGKNQIHKELTKRRVKVLCINDDFNINQLEFAQTKRQLIADFDSFLSNKSTFEE